MTSPDPELTLRVVLRRPPAGVAFALQTGSAIDGGYPAFDQVQCGDGQSDIAFHCTVRARLGSAGEAPRFLGPATHGPPAKRFIYLTVGRRAGQPDSPWDRRVKVPLAGITSDMATEAVGHQGAVLEAALEGTLRDGSPTCATRPFIAGRSWAVARVGD